MIEVHAFNKQGKLVGPIESAKVVLSDAEWAKRLTPEQFSVLRSSGTERPFCGALLDTKVPGAYTCAGCGLPLFSSDSKFHSGTGWPSFFQPIAEGNVVQRTDRGHGMSRTEVNCARCDGHLGHVFDDGPKPTHLRFCMNSASLNFTPTEDVAKLADPDADKPIVQVSHKQEGGADKTASSISAKTTAVFAGGCFWCTEAAFEQLEGVSDVTSGYTGGAKETANYKAVCSGATGHAEAIRVTYDPQKITFDRLLDVFFDAHDPTQLNRQGADVGTQYRSAIFFADDSQRTAAEAKIKAIDKSDHFTGPIMTSLEPLKEFYVAEDYHQNYAQNNSGDGYIQAIAIPKVCKIRDRHPDWIKKNPAPATN